MNESAECPRCGSADVLFSRKRQHYVCEDCNHAFPAGETFAARRIFISYGHDEHAALARRLKQDLQARGHEVWFDVDRLKPGGDWEAYIEEGINWVCQDPATGRVILLMTPHSVRRPDGYCLNEVARAIAGGLSPIPIMVVWAEPPLSICRIQWLDMQDCVPISERSERYHPKFRRLVEALEQDRLDFEGTQARLLHVLEPLPFDAEIAQHVTRFTGREWVFRRLRSWLAQKDAPRVFWITGPPGVGKTAIASWLCERWRHVAAFHLCRDGHDQKADPRRCVLSIAYQLSCELPEYQSRLSALHLEKIVAESGARTLFDTLIVQPLARNFPVPDRTILIVIDALDEATRGGENELARFLASEFDSTPGWMRLVVTSRTEPEVMHPLQGLTPYRLDAAAPENREDISAYLHEALRSVAGGAQVLDQAIEAIITRSEGLFLYAEHVTKELQSGRLSLDRMDEFPRGLGGVYAGFLYRRFPYGTAARAAGQADIETYRRRCLPALEIVCAAREPVTVRRIACLLGWSEYDEMQVVDLLGSLFAVVNGRFQPFHKSVAEWLTDRSRAGPYFVSEAQGHRRLSDMCWQEYTRGVRTMSPYARRFALVHFEQAGEIDRKEALERDRRFAEVRGLLQWRTLRVFVSSTFRDMHAERDHLARTVFPELRERCRRLRVHLADVDLRWGVTAEQADSGDALGIVLREMSQCDVFVSILGERYGWVPPAHELPGDEALRWVRQAGPGLSTLAIETYHVITSAESGPRAFFYFRDPSFIATLPAERQAEFCPEGPEHADRLARLKGRIRASGLPVADYRYDDLDAFGQRVLEDLWAAISAQYPEPEEIDLEREQHSRFIRSRSESLVGSRDLLGRLLDYARGDQAGPVVVQGAPGLGKSALLARFVEQFRQRHPEISLLYHFVGVSAASADPRSILFRLGRELAREFEIEAAIPEDYAALRRFFPQMLKEVAAQCRVVMVMDDLGRVHDEAGFLGMDWLPAPLSGQCGLRLILGGLPEHAVQSLSRRCRDQQVIAMHPPQPPETREYLEGELAKYGKRLSEGQMSKLLSRIQGRGSSLYLRLVVDELRQIPSFDLVDATIEYLRADLRGLFARQLERLEEDIGHEFVRRALTLIVSSPRGLSESELLQRLARHGEEDAVRAQWRRLYRAARLLFRPLDFAGGAEGAIDVVHPQLADVVRTRYLHPN